MSYRGHSSRGRGQYGQKRHHDNRDKSQNGKVSKTDNISVPRHEWHAMMDAVTFNFTVLNHMQNINSAIITTPELLKSGRDLRQAMLDATSETKKALPKPAFKHRNDEMLDKLTARMEEQQKATNEMQQKNLQIQEQMLNGLNKLQQSHQAATQNQNRETATMMQATQQIYNAVIPTVNQTAPTKAPPRTAAQIAALPKPAVKNLTQMQN